MYEVLLENARTIIVVTASVKEDKREAKVTLLQAYCIGLSCDTALSTCIVFTRMLFDFMFRFVSDEWQNQTCLHQVLCEA
jgi:hypothetical protein